MKIRALGSQITIYDDDMNIIQEIPERPPEDPDAEVRMINIVDYEDRLMGIDPDERPAHFLNFETDERFKPVYTIEDYESLKLLDPQVYRKCASFFLWTVGFFMAGYLFARVLFY